LVWFSQFDLVWSAWTSWGTVGSQFLSCFHSTTCRRIYLSRRVSHWLQGF